MTVRGICAAMGVLVLGACVNVGLGGGKAPDQLFTLRPAAVLPAGAASQGNLHSAMVVTEPAVPYHLDVARIPVQVNATALAYLVDGHWVEKPARLFQRLLSETIRARGTRLVVAGGELQYGAALRLEGELSAMEYDAASQRVVVRYDAALRQPDGTIRQRRFESEVSGVLPTAAAVAPAINRAANAVAAQVAEWVD